ncbi:hypothetical protein OG906_33580 [Streptomyces sp. NBC_01426]|uniref:hypothetical protein n=1 Tax=Streptomyces sp. NBC_01426 TaxID=2975866 RepID=UPI002E2F61A3|nr:hypothetical protein [Streptomyces sp. NBC_01426]
MNPVLLRLYPAGFRRAFGTEMAEAYREAVEGAGPRARLREAADVVAHALRLRLGLGSAYPGGRLFAAAAPFALAATASYAAFNLIGNAADWYVMRTAANVVGDPAALTTLMNGSYLLTLIGAVLALAGRYVPGVLAAIAGTALTAVTFLFPVWRMAPELYFAVYGFLFAPVLVAALPLACPPDLRPARRLRSTVGVVALVGWAVLLVAVMVVVDPLGLGLVVPWRLGVPLAAALVLAGRPAFAGIRTPARLALAAVPLLVILYFSGWVSTEKVLTAAGAVAVTMVALRIHDRRGNSSDTANPA